MLLASAFSAPAIPRVHAATGTVCLGDPSLAASFTACPASAPVFSGPVGQLIRIGVFISGSDPYNAFDITLFGNHTWLKPNDADLTGTTLDSVAGPAVTVLQCIGGRLIHGTTCSATDTIDTIHLAAVTAVGAPTTTVSGLLFTAIYNITSTTSAGGIPVKFQTGCTGTSDLGVCVTVPNPNGGPPNVEVVQTASFDNSASATLPDVVLSASPTSFGPEPPATSNTATVTATAKNGYPGSATDSVTFSFVATAGLSVSISGVNPCVTGGTSCSVSLIMSSTSAGNYFVTVYGTYATVDASGNPDTLSSFVALSVSVNDFGFSVSPTTITFDKGTTGTATVTLTSQGGFAGNVTLTAPTIIGNAGLTVSFSQSTVPLLAGSTVTSTAIFSSTTTGSNARVKITATSNGRSKSTSPLLFVNVRGGSDYTLISTPSTVAPIVVGSAGTATITVKPILNFAGTVSLTNSTGGLGLACSLSPNSITLGAQQNSTLSCTGSVGGVYLVQVTGMVGSNATLTHVVFVSFTVEDFAISANPASVSTLAKAQATSVISVTSLEGFSGVVALTSAVSPSSGLTCGLSPTSVNGFGSSTLSCTGIAGVYTVQVNGTSGSVVRSVNVVFTVQDFGVAANPLTVNFGGGSSGTSQILISPMDGFTGNVVLSFKVSDASLTASFNSTTVNGGSGGATLTLSDSVIGAFSVNVTGTSGSLGHSVIINVNVLAIPDFTISASPSTVSVQPGSIANSTITLTSLNKLNGTITLTDTVAPSGLTCTFTPASVMVSSTATTGTSKLSCSGSPGSYSITVSGVNGTLTHSTAVTIKIQDVTMTASSPTAVNAGQSATSTITVTSVGGIAGTVSLTDTVPSGLTCGAISPASVTLSGSPQTATVSCSSTSAGSFMLSITGTMTSPVITRTASATFSFLNFTIAATSPLPATVGASATSTISVTAQGGFSGTVALTDAVSSTNGLTCTLSPPSIAVSTTSTLSCSSSQTGTSTVTVTGTSGSLSHSATVSVVVWDFGLTESTSVITVYENASTIVTMSLASLNGFTGPVSLTAGIVKPPGFTSGPLPTATLSSSVVTVPAGGSASVNVNVTVAPGVLPNVFAVQVNATAGSRAESNVVSMTVPTPKVSIVSSPGSLVVGPSVSGVSQIKVTSVGGLHGMVGLSLGVPSAALSCSLSQSSLAVQVDGSATTGLVCSGKTGVYNVTITGQATTPGGATIHVSSFVGVSVVDFTVSSTPSGVLVDAGKIAHASITISWPSNYKGNVTLSLVPVAGLNASLQSSTLSGPGSVTVDMSSATGGVYTLVVNATSGSSSHTVSLTVTVQGVQQSPPLPSEAIYAIVGLVIVAGGAGVFLGLRRRRKVSRK